MPTREEMIAQIRAAKERERMISEIRAARAPSGPKSPETSAAQAGLEHFGNEALLGHLPHAQALVESFLPDPNADLDRKLREQGFNLEEKKDSYVGRRDENLKRLAKMEEEHPIASTVGKAVGIVGLPGLAAIKGAKAAVGAAKGLQAASKLDKAIAAGKVVATGGAMGAAYNPGDVEGELDPFQTDARMHGGTIGAVAAPAALVAGKAVVGAGKWAAEKGAKTFKKIADRSAFKALEPRRTNQVKTLIEKGRADEIGRTMLDEGVLSPGATFDDIAARAKELKTVAGGELDEVLGIISKFEQQGGDMASRKALAAKLRERFVPKGPGVEAVAGKQGIIDKWAAIIDEFERAGDDAMPIEKLQALKQAYGNEVNWNRPKMNDVPEPEQLYRAMYGELKDAAENQAEKVASRASKQPALPGPGVTPAPSQANTLDRLRAAKKKYGNSKTIADIAEESQGRELTKQFFGLTDNQTGVGSAVVGAATADDPEDMLKRGVMGFIGGKVAARLNRKLSPQTIAIGSDKVAKALARRGDALGKYSQPLINAMNRSPKAFTATYSMLLKDPEFRQTIQRVADEREPDRSPADLPKGGPDRWAAVGLQKLGIHDEALAEKLMQSPEGRAYLIQASDLTPGSKAFKNIQEQIKKGWGSK